MRAERSEYAVAGWGTGTLWTSPMGVVLAHEFAFEGDGSQSARRQGVGPVGSDPTRVEPVGSPAGSEPFRMQATSGVGVAPSARGVVPRLVAFLAGDPAPLTSIALDLGWCSPFQRAVLDALRAVRRGEVVSYGELAAVAGYPNAQRAVGTLCARNRFAFAVPCHRVVGANGIGRYGSAGACVKRRLLALEGVEL